MGETFKNHGQESGRFSSIFYKMRKRPCEDSLSYFNYNLTSLKFTIYKTYVKSLRTKLCSKRGYCFMIYDQCSKVVNKLTHLYMLYSMAFSYLMTRLLMLAAVTFARTLNYLRLNMSLHLCRFRYSVWKSVKRNSCGFTYNVKIIKRYYFSIKYRIRLLRFIVMVNYLTRLYLYLIQILSVLLNSRQSYRPVFELFGFECVISATLTLLSYLPCEIFISIIFLINWLHCSLCFYYIDGYL